MDQLRRFLPLLLLLGAMALVFAMGWNRYLSLATIQTHGAELRALVAEHYVLTLLALIVVFAAATASVIPGVFFITITAGFLFGTWVGGLATSLAATLGALAVYFVSRSALGQSLRDRAARDQGLLQRVCEAIDKDTFWYVLASRLAVVVPFHMINLAAGIMSVRLTPYVVATFIGLLPAHFIYCWIGARLNSLLAVDPNPDFQGLFNQFAAPLAGVFVLAVILPLGLKWLQGRLSRRTTP
ncbi:MAG: TVP38/TMEM64 family protein [Brevundimonas sp.]|nr:MAG: TVP38/TMEM64 family protein [Brevundimonas sp.]